MTRYLTAMVAAYLIFSSAMADDWERLAPMPTARSEMSAAVWGNVIYVPGGLGGTRSFEAYDTLKEQWVELPQMPEGRHHIAIATYKAKLYVFGGADDSWRASDSSFVFNIQTGQWSRVAPMPAVRYAAGAAVIGSYIYVVGGDGPGGHTLRYDPASNRWKKLVAPRIRREHTTVVESSGQLVLIGGRWPGVGELANVEIYDPATNSWREGPKLATARGGFTAVNHHNRIYAFGGEVMMTGSKTLASVEQLTDKGWRPATPMPRALHGVPVVSLNDYIYVLGGSQRAGAIVNDGQTFRSNRY
ncbi:MAG: hypothetical protein OER98_16670 [Gammaproteobacteria bacterium]|nr:hypothetical protein [Gammaproteobacteria bacterium]